MNAQVSADARTPFCPRWCIVTHGELLGEEDWVHISLELTLSDGRTARLCASINPNDGATDGPYVLIGEHQYTMSTAERLGVPVSVLEEPASEPDSSETTVEPRGDSSGWAPPAGATLA